MKTSLLQYLALTLICTLSSYSFWYLNARSQDLQKHQQTQLVHPTVSASTTVPFVKPPAQQDPNQKDNAPKPKKNEDNILPDVQFLKFIIDKGKEGIPVLDLPQFFH